MGRLIQGLLDTLKLTDEDDDFDDEDYDLAPETKKKRETVTNREKPPLRRYDTDNTDLLEEEDEEDDDEPLAQRRTFTPNRTPQQRPVQQQRREFPPRLQQPQTKTAVPLRSSLTDRKIYVLNPRSFEDAQEVCETLKSGGVVFMNFEGVKHELAQRLMDFAGGAVYALDGQIYQISGYNFIVAPGDTDIEGDILAQITKAGVEFPTFSKY